MELDPSPAQLQGHPAGLVGRVGAVVAQEQRDEAGDGKIVEENPRVDGIIDGLVNAALDFRPGRAGANARLLGDLKSRHRGYETGRQKVERRWSKGGKKGR